MEIGDFILHRPATLEEACLLGRTYGKGVRFLAGGTELLADLKQHRDATQHLVALGSIPGLSEIRQEGQGLLIGALATLSEVAESPLVQEHFPALTEAILTMAAPQIRNRASLGGNFCGGVPSADTPPICIAGGAEVRIAGPSGLRSLPAEDFFLGPRKVALSPGEILTGVLIPDPPPNSGASYQRLALRQATALAVAGVAARIDLRQERIRVARVVLGALAPVPLPARRCSQMLEGEVPSEALFARAAEAALEEAKPISDLRGSAEYRRAMVRVLAIRALNEAAARARQAGGR
jgi:carbon-monoxide dehydrogenase medium subunit